MHEPTASKTINICGSRLARIFNPGRVIAWGAVSRATQRARYAAGIARCGGGPCPRITSGYQATVYLPSVIPRSLALDLSLASIVNT